MTCVYLGPHTQTDEYSCQLFGRCRLINTGPDLPACDTCQKRLALNSPTFAQDWRDPVVLYTAGGEQTPALRGILAGRAAFLACGGPSTKQLPLHRLNERGCWTMSVNNMGGHPDFRSQAMVCSDPPMKFSHSIWLDPAVMKFVPHPKITCRGRGVLRKKADGVFGPLTDEKGEQLSVRHMPNAWGFKRRRWMAIDDSFFLEDSVPVGNYDEGVKRTGEQKTICTLAAAMRLIRYLGAKEVFLIGVDFRMVAEDRYGFKEKSYEDCLKCGAKMGIDGKCTVCGLDGTTLESVSAENNRQFSVVNDCLCRLQKQGVFKRFGISFFNCNRNSGLRAFPYVSFSDAIQRVQCGIEQRPDLDRWYQK